MAFFEEYLVAEDATEPIVFRGRDEEFDLLGSWLQDHEKPPPFVMATPAGRGKSAVLVNWIRQLETASVIGDGDDRWRLVFVPISIRFRTNRPDVYYEAIARGIADILGEDQGIPQIRLRRSICRLPIHAAILNLTRRISRQQIRAEAIRHVLGSWMGFHCKRSLVGELLLLG
jgi:hypothetical protein